MVKMCDADVLGSSSRCTLAEGHAPTWHQEWTYDDHGTYLVAEWKYSRKEELAKATQEGNLYNDSLYVDGTK